MLQKFTNIEMERSPLYDVVPNEDHLTLLSIDKGDG